MNPEPYKNRDIISLTVQTAKIEAHKPLLAIEKKFTEILKVTDYRLFDIATCRELLKRLKEEFTFDRKSLRRHRRISEIIHDISKIGSNIPADDPLKSVYSILRNNARDLFYSFMEKFICNKYQILDYWRCIYKYRRLLQHTNVELCYLASTTTLDKMQTKKQMTSTCFSFCQQFQTPEEFDTFTNVRELIKFEIRILCQFYDFSKKDYLPLIDSYISEIFHLFRPMEQAWCWTLLQNLCMNADFFKSNVYIYRIMQMRKCELRLQKYIQPDKEQQLQQSAAQVNKNIIYKQINDFAPILMRYTMAKMTDYLTEVHRQIDDGQHNQLSIEHYEMFLRSRNLQPASTQTEPDIHPSPLFDVVNETTVTFVDNLSESSIYERIDDDYQAIDSGKTIPETYESTETASGTPMIQCSASPALAQELSDTFLPSAEHEPSTPPPAPAFDNCAPMPSEEQIQIKDELLSMSFRNHPPTEAEFDTSTVVFEYNDNAECDEPTEPLPPSPQNAETRPSQSQIQVKSEILSNSWIGEVECIEITPPQPIEILDSQNTQDLIEHLLCAADSPKDPADPANCTSSNLIEIEVTTTTPPHDAHTNPSIWIEDVISPAPPQIPVCKPPTTTPSSHSTKDANDEHVTCAGPAIAVQSKRNVMADKRAASKAKDLDRTQIIQHDFGPLQFVQQPSAKTYMPAPLSRQKLKRARPQSEDRDSPEFHIEDASFCGPVNNLATAPNDPTRSQMLNTHNSVFLSSQLLTSPPPPPPTVPRRAPITVQAALIVDSDSDLEELNFFGESQPASLPRRLQPKVKGMVKRIKNPVLAEGRADNPDIMPQPEVNEILTTGQLANNGFHLPSAVISDAPPTTALVGKSTFAPSSHSPRLTLQLHNICNVSFNLSSEAQPFCISVVFFGDFSNIHMFDDESSRVLLQCTTAEWMAVRPLFYRQQIFSFNAQQIQLDNQHSPLECTLITLFMSRRVVRRALAIRKDVVGCPKKSHALRYTPDTVNVDASIEPWLVAAMREKRRSMLSNN